MDNTTRYDKLIAWDLFKTYRAITGMEIETGVQFGNLADTKAKLDNYVNQKYGVDPEETKIYTVLDDLILERLDKGSLTEETKTKFGELF